MALPNFLPVMLPEEHCGSARFKLKRLAARQAMPALLEIAKGQRTDSGYGNELTEIFRGFGDDKGEETTEMLNAKLNRCPNSDERDKARRAIEQAKQTAQQFVKDFGRLEGA